MNRRVVFIPLMPLMVGLAACSDQTANGPAAATPSLDIADAAHDYGAGFYWLAPMVPQPGYAGAFDDGLSPKVEICELVARACGPTIATYTTTGGPGGEVVRLDLDEQHYHVNWHTNEFTVSTSWLYRVSVRAGVHDVLLGYADVQPVSNGGGLKNVETGEYIGLVDGRTLPIKFRIETGIVGGVEVQPVEAEIQPGATQQFVAIVTDLHGEPVPADVAWASSDEAVATVDQDGLATAVTHGEATITAASQGISGSATLRVEGGLPQVSAGDGHACAITAEGRAYCWGEGFYGQLGNGGNGNQWTPVAVSGNLEFSAIDAGYAFTCAVTGAGQAYCWGLSRWGQLGNGTATDRSTPQPVAGGLDFASITAGGSHACGVATDGQGYCWGSNADGLLGDGSGLPISTPTSIAGGLSFASISAGALHTCGVTTDGRAYCWGNGSRGALGNGSTSNQPTPVAVAGDLVFASISAGQVHTCGVTSAGQAYCWGLGDFGRLGNGATTTWSTPQHVAGNLSFASIAAGGEHTCAVTTAGPGYCWGGNLFGALGTGNLFQRTTPGLVSGNLSFSMMSSAQRGTYGFTCGVTIQGQLYCWGEGSAGHLGNGSNITRNTPTPVAAFP